MKRKIVSMMLSTISDLTKHFEKKFNTIDKKIGRIGTDRVAPPCQNVNRNYSPFGHQPYSDSYSNTNNPIACNL